MLCRLYQWQMELQLDGGQKIWSRRLQKHLNRCKTCREHAHRLTAVTEMLTAHPPVVFSEKACRSLAANAVKYVERGQSSDSFAQKRLNSFGGVKRFAGAMAASLLLAAGLLMFNAKHDKAFESEISPLNLGARAFQAPLPTVAEWSLKPMQTEIEKLINSAQDAAIFLWNCTPGHFEQVQDGSEKNESSERHE